MDAVELELFNFVTNGTLHNILMGVLFLLLGVWLVNVRLKSQRSARWLFAAFLILHLVTLLLVFAVYFQEWYVSTSCALCKYLVPPYSNYYFNQVIVRWLSSFAFNAAVGLTGGILFSLFARATKGRIIDQVDVDLLTVGGMVAGWPNILIFYGAVFMLTVLTTAVRAIAERSASIRMIITPVLPFAAAAVAVFGNQLARLLHLYEIGFTLVG